MFGLYLHKKKYLYVSRIASEDPIFKKDGPVVLWFPADYPVFRNFQQIARLSDISITPEQ